MLHQPALPTNWYSHGRTVGSRRKPRSADEIPTKPNVVRLGSLRRGSPIEAKTTNNAANTTVVEPGPSQFPVAERTNAALTTPSSATTAIAWVITRDVATAATNMSSTGTMNSGAAFRKGPNSGMFSGTMPLSKPCGHETKKKYVCVNAAVASTLAIRRWSGRALRDSTSSSTTGLGSVKVQGRLDACRNFGARAGGEAV